jgi:hypothetical protein
MVKKQLVPADYGRNDRYDDLTRTRIDELINKEWAKMHNKMANGDEFHAHITKLLKEAGIKSPDGGPLSARGVKYQVYRNGIRFRKQKPTAAVPSWRDAPREASRFVEKPKTSQAHMQTGAAPAAPNDMITIIATHPSLSAEQKIEMIKGLLGAK